MKKQEQAQGNKTDALTDEKTAGSTQTIYNGGLTDKTQVNTEKGWEITQTEEMKSKARHEGRNSK